MVLFKPGLLRLLDLIHRPSLPPSPTIDHQVRWTKDHPGGAEQRSHLGLECKRTKLTYMGNLPPPGPELTRNRDSHRPRTAISSPGSPMARHHTHNTPAGDHPQSFFCQPIIQPIIISLSPSSSSPFHTMHHANVLHQKQLGSSPFIIFVLLFILDSCLTLYQDHD